MDRTLTRIASLLLLSFAVGACDVVGRGGDGSELAAGLTADSLAARLARYAPVEIDANTDDLEPWERIVLERLIRASDAVAEAHRLQVAPGHAQLRARLQAGGAPWSEDARALFDLMAGPWDRLGGDAPFLAVDAKPAGAGFYPEDLTSEDLDAWLAEHPEDREAFTSPYTVLRREHGTLISVPYSVEYEAQLQAASALLREAAAASRDRALAAYLERRAIALTTDLYAASEVLWAELGGSRIEPRIGPFGAAEDGLRGRKEAFGSVVALADDRATAALGVERSRLGPAYASLAAAVDSASGEGAGADVRVVDLLYATGAANAGTLVGAVSAQAAGDAPGGATRRTVLLRNVVQARFERILQPVAEVVLGPVAAEALDFDAWFSLVGIRALSFGIGPADAPVHALHPSLEQAKADAIAVFALSTLARDGVIGAARARSAYAAHVADLFRLARLGVDDVRGEAAAILFSWIWERQGIFFNEEFGGFMVDAVAYEDACRALASEILRIQRERDDDAAATLRDRYGEMRPEMADLLPSLEGIPVELRPIFTVLDRMAGWGQGQ